MVSLLVPLDEGVELVGSSCNVDDVYPSCLGMQSYLGNFEVIFEGPPSRRCF